MRPESSYFGKFIIQIGALVRAALPIAAGLALLVFLWGLMTFLFQIDKVDEGKARMRWGVLALFILFSVWGFVNLLRVMLGVDAVYTPPAPSAPCGRIPVSEGGIPCL